MQFLSMSEEPRLLPRCIIHAVQFRVLFLQLEHSFIFVYFDHLILEQLSISNFEFQGLRNFRNVMFLQSLFFLVHTEVDWFVNQSDRCFIASSCLVIDKLNNIVFHDESSSLDYFSTGAFIFRFTGFSNNLPNIKFAFNSSVPKLFSPLEELFLREFNCICWGPFDSFPDITFWNHMF